MLVQHKYHSLSLPHYYQYASIPMRFFSREMLIDEKIIHHSIIVANACATQIPLFKSSPLLSLCLNHHEIFF